MSWTFYSPRSSCLCVGHILGGHILWASKSCACCRCACHRSPKSIQTTALTPFVNALHKFLDPRPASTSLSTISQKGARSHLPDHRFRADPRNTPIVLVLINILFTTSFDMEINIKNRPRTYCAPVLVTLSQYYCRSTRLENTHRMILLWNPVTNTQSGGSRHKVF